MKETRILMGMPITIEVVDTFTNQNALEKAFSYFEYIDDKFSPFKESSEVSLINRKKITQKDFSSDMKAVLSLAEKTREETSGYFNVFSAGKFDPSGLVKGWAVFNAADILKKEGFKNFYIDAGGDVEAQGRNKEGRPWRIGIRNPFNQEQIVKVAYVKNRGVATSGTYIRGKHIYDPSRGNKPADEIASLTVIGPNIYEADRFATAAFAMGKKGITFIESLEGFEGYMIDKKKLATFTSGFETYTASP